MSGNMLRTNILMVRKYPLGVGYCFLFNLGNSTTKKWDEMGWGISHSPSLAGGWWGDNWLGWRYAPCFTTTMLQLLRLLHLMNDQSKEESRMMRLHWLGTRLGLDWLGPHSISLNIGISHSLKLSSQCIILKTFLHVSFHSSLSSHLSPIRSIEIAIPFLSFLPFLSFSLFPIPCLLDDRPSRNRARVYSPPILFFSTQ